MLDVASELTTVSWELFASELPLDILITHEIIDDTKRDMSKKTHNETDVLETSIQKFDARMQLTLTALREKSEAQIEEILDFVRRVDKQLQWLDMLLYYTQPPTSGRIRIIWKRPAPESAHRPYLVSWTLVSEKNGKELWRYRMLKKPTKAVRGKGGFATHRAEVVRLVALAADLIKEHDALTGYLSNLSRAWIMKERYLSDKEIETVNEMILLIDRINEKGRLHLDYNRIMT